MITPNSVPVFFQEIDLAPNWTLYDLIWWISFSRPAFYEWRESPEDIRDGTDILYDGMYSLGRDIIGVMIEEESAMSGLGRDPYYVAEDLEKEWGDDYPHAHYFAGEWIYSFGTKALTDESYHADVWSRVDDQLKTKIIDYHNYRLAWENALEDYLDVAKSRVFVALREGKISAKGYPVKYTEDREELYDNITENLYVEDDYQSARVPIPSKFWSSRKIDWNASSLSTEQTYFAAVTVKAEDVFKSFPINLQAKETMIKVGVHKVALIEANSDNHFRSKGGRPPKNWEEIAIHISEVISLQGGLPAKQDAFASEIADWYAKKFGQTIGLSTIKTPLKPYYSNTNIKKS